MKVNFLTKSEFSVIGTLHSTICGINIKGHFVPFTGAVSRIENFGITAEELAVFAVNAESVHFEREVVYVPLRGTK